MKYARHVRCTPVFIMKRALVVCSLGFSLVCGSAVAQDRTPEKPKVVQAPRPAVPRPQVVRDDPFATAASQAATIAEKEASCLREAAQRVQSLSLRLRAATDPAQIQKQREELDFAVGVIDECRNIARQRSKESPPVETPAPAAPEKAPTGLFSFGSIGVEDGLDPAMVVRTLRSQSQKLARCYEPHDAKGAVKLRLRLAQSGKGASPTAIAVEESSVDDPAVHRCVARTLMQSSFPAKAAGSEVSMEIGFAPPAK